MKAQISSMFSYLTAAIIIGVILLLGTYGVVTLLDTTDRINRETFKADFERIIRDISSEYGSVKYQTFQLSQDYVQVCFVDGEAMHTVSLQDNNLTRLPFVKGELADNSSNIFLVKQNGDIDKFLNQKIHVTATQRYICEEIKGSFVVRLEGYGKYAEVSFDSP